MRLSHLLPVVAIAVWRWVARRQYLPPAFLEEKMSVRGGQVSPPVQVWYYTTISKTPVQVWLSSHFLLGYKVTWGQQLVVSLPIDGGLSMHQDVYTEVAEIVRRRVLADVNAGVPLAVEVLAEIDRKLVKQTVMTSVYGVTISGTPPPPVFFVHCS